MNNNGLSIPEMSADTRFLLQRLQTTKEDEVIEYSELSELIGRDVQREARGNLTSAMKSCLREGIVLECVRKVGVKRLSNNNIPDAVSSSTITRIRHAAKKGVKKIACTDITKLTQSEQLRMWAGMSMLSTISAVATERKMQSLEKACSSGELPLSRTLEAFKG